MSRVSRSLMLGFISLICVGLAWAAEPYTGFNASSARGFKLSPTFNGFQFDNKPDSSVGWMHMIQQKDGSFLTLLFTAANLGPYHLSTSIGAMYTKPGGPTYTCSELWRDDAHFTAPPKDRYWVRVNNSYFGGKYPDFQVKLNDGGCKGEVKFTSVLPSYSQGSGLATFGSKSVGTWQLLAISPRAKATGSLQFPGGKVTVDGDAYLEVVSTDMMVPQLADRWYILHYLQGPWTLNVFDIVVDKSNYGEGHVRTLMLAKDNQIIMGTTQFTYQPQGGWKHDDSGITVPQSFKLGARDGAVSLTGTVKYGKNLDVMNLLEKLPLPARVYAGVRYGTPYQFRSAAELELTVTENGVSTPIKGTGFSEIHFYDR